MRRLLLKLFILPVLKKIYILEVVVEHVDLWTESKGYYL